MHHLKENFSAATLETREEKTFCIGDIFRQAREKQNISLEHACQVLKIRRLFLNAIENNNFTDLPGGVYTLGFVQSYGKFLKIDSSSLKEILQTLQLASSFPEFPPKSPFIKDETYFPPWILVTSFIFSLIIVITFLAFRLDFGASKQQIVPSHSLIGASPLTLEFDVSQLNPALITFYALDHTWIKLTNSYGKAISTKLLSPGELYQIDRQDNLYLTTGNSQVLKVYCGYTAIDLPLPSSRSLSTSLYQSQELLEDFLLE